MFHISYPPYNYNKKSICICKGRKNGVEIKAAIRGIYVFCKLDEQIVFVLSKEKYTPNFELNHGVIL